MKALILKGGELAQRLPIEAPSEAQGPAEVAAISDVAGLATSAGLAELSELALAARNGRSTRSAGTVAVSDDNGQWALINMSPAVADQLACDARLLAHPGLSVPSARVVILTDAQLDHMSGLLSLRDGPPVHLYATPVVYEDLAHNTPILPMLQHYCGVNWHVIGVAGECSTAVFQIDTLPQLEFTAIATQAPLPRHVSEREGRRVGDSIVLAVRERRTGQRLFCAPSLAGLGATALAWMQGADCVLIGDAQSHLADDRDSTAQRTFALRDTGASDALTRPGEHAVELAADRQLIDV